MAKISKMLSEIREQPQAIAQTLDKCKSGIQAAAKLIKQRKPAFLVMNARGTSSHAALYAKYLFEAYAGVPVAFGAPSLFTLYGARPDYSNSLILGISQSGASEDLLTTMEAVKSAGAAAIAVTNTSGSPITQLADVTLLTRAGKEKAVAATKTFTTQLAVLAALVAEVSGDKPLTTQLAKTPELVAETLKLEAEVAEKTQRYRYMAHCAMLGRGFNLGTAYEAALKLTECAYVASQGFSMATFEHGPKALATDGFPVFVYAAKGAAYDQAFEAVGRYHQQGAEVFAVANCKRLVNRATSGVHVPVKMHESVSPIALIPVAQLFAFNVACAKGYNPDQPRLLNKVTSTK